MSAIPNPLRDPHRAAAGALLLAAAAFAALAGSPGGQTLAAFGAGTVALRGDGPGPFTLVPNLRVEFDGGPADLSGTGTVTAYNAAGNAALGSLPFTWTAHGRTSVTLSLDPGGLASFLRDRLEEAAGMPAAATVIRSSCKGKMKRGGTEMALNLKASGLASLGEGPDREMQVKIRCR